MNIRRVAYTSAAVCGLLAAAAPFASLFAGDAAPLPGAPVPDAEPLAPACYAEPDRCTIPLSGPMKASFVTPAPAVRAVPVAKVTPTATLVNTRKLRLNYQINDVGPSGISAVELWATRDGKNWQRYSNEPPPSGPLVVQVAEEGKYGFHLVVKNGVSVSSPAPVTGDEPQLWVEVDETAPVVRLRDVTAGTGDQAGVVHISWTATDTNMGHRPVSILYSKCRTGPWETVATAREATGRYIWKTPRRTPHEVYVRVEATDKAGNVGGTTAVEPVRVDVVRPRGTVTGVDASPVPTVPTTYVTPPALVAPLLPPLPTN